MSALTEFTLLGFQASHNIRMIMYFLLLVVYCVTISMNLLIIALVSTNKNLHTPMYFFLSQLFINDILLTTGISPNTLHILLNNGATIPFIGCIAQLYFFSASEASECLILTVMSYDRYVAICNPLRYTSLMTGTYCMILAIASWLVGFIIMLITTITTSVHNFCGPYLIDHFFCDLVPLLEISCSDTYSVQMEVSVLSIPLVFIPIIIIIFSYTRIIITTLRIPSSTGRQKAFSTCSSHLIVVSIFYWTMFSVYVFPKKGGTSSINKILSLLYTVFTPLINPIIYSLKNKDIKRALRVQVNRRVPCLLPGHHSGIVLRHSKPHKP